MSTLTFKQLRSVKCSQRYYKNSSILADIYLTYRIDRSKILTVSVQLLNKDVLNVNK